MLKLKSLFEHCMLITYVSFQFTFTLLPGLKLHAQTWNLAPSNWISPWRESVVLDEGKESMELFRALNCLYWWKSAPKILPILLHIAHVHKVGVNSWIILLSPYIQYIWFTLMILSLYGLWRLAFVARHITVPPNPLHGPFPCDVAKKWHSAYNEKSSLWQVKFAKFFLFLYWAEDPSVK